MSAVERLAEIEARLAAAPAGEWYAHEDGGVWVDHSEGERLSMSGLTGEFPVWADGAADLIAHAPADIKALTAALRAVLALHQPLNDLGSPPCSSCLSDDEGEVMFVLYPCPTVRAITAALTPAATS